jgi:hypothetical protein
VHTRAYLVQVEMHGDPQAFHTLPLVHSGTSTSGSGVGVGVTTGLTGTFGFTAGASYPALNCKLKANWPLS